MTQTTIGLLLFDGAEELDFVGPFEVFTMTNEVAAENGREEPNRVLLLSPNGGETAGAKGMKIAQTLPMTSAPALDVICVPGGQGTRALVQDRAVLDWVSTAARDCTWITSVCTGSFVLAAAGLTAGKRLTTHWQAVDEFKKLGLAGELLSGYRYVRDGNLLTAAGVSAGIDMALWLTGQMHGVTLARETQKAMEYDPAPPYAAWT